MTLMKLILFKVFLFIPLCCLSQNYSGVSLDTLNRYDESGEKHGYWIVYLNDRFKPVKRKRNAVFFWLKYYYYGVTLRYHYLLPYSISNRVDVVVNGNEPGEPGNPVLLNGEYKIKYRNGAKFVALFDQGRLLRFAKHQPNGQIYQDFHYNKDNTDIIAIHYSKSGSYNETVHIYLEQGKWKFKEVE